MEQVDIRRYELTGVLGTGADYEVRAALDRETGQQVVLKRPIPQMVHRRLHAGIEARTDQALQMYRDVGQTIPNLVPLLGYTERARHDAYFGDALGQEYRVLVASRAPGIPLVGETRARFRGVPIGVGQHLFALFPLIQGHGHTPFAIHQQLLDLEAQCLQAGYLLLDLQPQNVFYQPLSGQISVIDCGAAHKNPGNPTRQPAPDLHNFYLEILQFYTTPNPPPLQASGYRDPYGVRSMGNFSRTLDEMTRQCKTAPDAAVQDAAGIVINRVRQRAYADLEAFRRDLQAYLHTVWAYHQSLPDLAAAQGAWAEALAWLRAPYWQRYLFCAETELAQLTNQPQSPGAAAPPTGQGQRPC